MSTTAIVILVAVAVAAALVITQRKKKGKPDVKPAPAPEAPHPPVAVTPAPTPINPTPVVTPPHPEPALLDRNRRKPGDPGYDPRAVRPDPEFSPIEPQGTFWGEGVFDPAARYIDLNGKFHNAG